MLGVVALEAGAGKPAFDAAALAAITGRTGPFIGRRPGQRIVSPFARDQVRALEPSAVHDDPTAPSRAEDDAEHAMAARARAVRGFGKREAVRVVHEPHGPAEPLLRI